MVRLSSMISHFIGGRIEKLRHFLARHSNDNSDDDTVTTVGTFSDERPSMNSRERVMAAIATLREEDEKKFNPMTVVLFKASIGLIAFPIVSYLVVKWSGLLRYADDSSIKQSWNEIVNESFDAVASVAMSGDGSVVAIGSSDPFNDCVSIFNVQPWELADQICHTSSDAFGSSVSMSEDGSIIAVNGIRRDGSRPGFVQTYQYNGTNWSPMGQPLLGQVHDEFYGSSFDVSDSGEVLVIGAPGSTVIDGKVEVYTFNSTHWIGKRIDDTDNSDQFGGVVRISADGKFVAIGSPSQVTGGSVQVYQARNNSWIPLSTKIYGKRDGEILGQSISIANNGDQVIVAVGSRSTEDTASRAQVFASNETGDWVQLKNDLFQVNAVEIVVELSKDGTVMAVGADQSTSIIEVNSASSWESLTPSAILRGGHMSLSTGKHFRLATTGQSANGEFVAIYEK